MKSVISTSVEIISWALNSESFMNKEIFVD